MLGLSVTLIIYLGGATFLLDRFLRERHHMRASTGLVRPAARALRRLRPGE